MVITDDDLTHLRRCVDLAREALADGDEPFGSVLAGPDGKVLVSWLTECGVPAGTVAPLPLTAVVPGAVAEGPVPVFEAELRDLHSSRFRR